MIKYMIFLNFVIFILLKFIFIIKQKKNYTSQLELLLMLFVIIRSIIISTLNNYILLNMIKYLLLAIFFTSAFCV